MAGKGIELGAKRHSYELWVMENGVEKPQNLDDAFVYSYGNTREVKLSLHEGVFGVIVQMGAAYSSDQLFKSPARLFDDAIRKALFIHLLRFGRSLLIQRVEVSIDGDAEQVSIGSRSSNEACYCSSVQSIVLPQRTFDDDMACDYLSRTRSAKEPFDSSLEAYVVAKSKADGFEKFEQLWISLEGLAHSYSTSIEERVADMGSTSMKCNIGDECKIKRFQRLHGYHSKHFKPSEKSNRVLAHKVIEAIKSEFGSTRLGLSDPFSNRAFVDRVNDLVQKNHDTTKSMPDARSYLLFGLPYYLRCSYFHANKPQGIVYRTDDEEHLAVICSIRALEGFLDANLYRWFEPSYRNGVLADSAQAEAETCLRNRTEKN